MTINCPRDTSYRNFKDKCKNTNENNIVVVAILVVHYNMMQQPLNKLNKLYNFSSFTILFHVRNSC